MHEGFEFAAVCASERLHRRRDWEIELAADMYLRRVRSCPPQKDKQILIAQTMLSSRSWLVRRVLRGQCYLQNVTLLRPSPKVCKVSDDHLFVRSFVLRGRVRG